MSGSYQESGEVLAQAAQGVGESPSLEVFQNRRDVALRVMANGFGGMGWGWTWGP